MEKPSFSLVDLKGVSQPLSKLVDAVSKGIGEIYKPVGILRIAKAQAKAKLILSKAEGEQKAITLRMHERLRHIEHRRQENIEKIITRAAAELPPVADKNPVDEDWINRFFQDAQDVGDGEMQILWARILAREVTQPGSFSSRVLSLVKTLNKHEAETFTALCKHLFRFPDNSHFLFIHAITYDYLRHSVSTPEETTLRDIGLLSSTTQHFGFVDGNEGVAFYHSQQVRFVVPERPNKSCEDLRTFKVIPLTTAGNELARISGASAVRGYLKELCSHQGLNSDGLRILVEGEVKKRRRSTQIPSTNHSLP